MTGTLKVKNDYYYAVINYKEDGKYKQKWVSLGLPVKNNKRRAEARLEEIKREFELSRESTNSNRILLTDYAKKWLEYKKPLISPITYDTYETFVYVHLIPYFEKNKEYINEVTRRTVREFFETVVRTKGAKGGETLRVGTMQTYKFILKSMMNQAVIDDLIDKNPVADVSVPTVSNKSPSDRHFLSAQEAMNFLNEIRNDKMYPIIYITLHYGLRRSEALGLRWDAIDFENGTLTIKHTVSQSKKIYARDETKTATSRCTFPLLDSARTVLLEMKNMQEEHKKLFGSEYHDTGYVFTKPNGDTFSPAAVGMQFKKLVDKFNLNGLRYHDLRHSTASILYESGWGMKDIQEWLRHANIATTTNIYTHITENRKIEIGKKISMALEKGVIESGDEPTDL